MSDSVRFWFRDRVVTVDDVPAGTSVLQWLREHVGATGTKEGCNEGDCGACTVVVGIPEETDGGTRRLDLLTADACLLLLPMLHGRALFTVEDVATAGVLHPVQRQLVDHHGSQCGFCTPGIVMSLWCEFERARGGPPPSRDRLADRLAGNLCRCTGYRSVLDAAEEAMAGAAPPPDALAYALDALATVPSDEPLDYRAAGSSFVAPTTIDGIVRALDADPDAVLLSGGTDLVLEARLAGRPLPPLVWTGRARDLATVRRTSDHLVIGAAASLEAAWHALADEVPALAPWWHRFAGPAIRAVGTLGGNVANGSPIADGTPVLLALDASVVLTGPDGSRTVPLAEFHLGRRTSVRGRAEVLERIEIPLVALRRDVRAFKVSRRQDSDITTASGVFALDLDGNVVRDVRMVFGGTAATVRRAEHAEAAVVGRPWTRETMMLALDALDDDVRPISDHRASAEHRLRTARGLVERWWLQTRPSAALAEHETEVWALR